jgi:hypothetical protein
VPVLDAIPPKKIVFNIKKTLKDFGDRAKENSGSR